MWQYVGLILSQRQLFSSSHLGVASFSEVELAVLGLWRFQAHSRLATLLASCRHHSGAATALESMMAVAPGGDVESRLASARLAARRKPAIDHYMLLGVPQACPSEEVPLFILPVSVCQARHTLLRHMLCRSRHSCPQRQGVSFMDSVSWKAVMHTC